MSVEALAFAKLTDLGDAEGPSARLLFYVIAENTYNDSGMCRIGKAELAYQMRASANTVRRQCAALEKAGRIKVTAKGGVGGGRQPDEIELLGFKDWLARQRNPPSQPPVNDEPKPQNDGGQPAKLAERGNPPNSTKTGGGNPPLVADIYDNRTSDRTSNPPTPKGAVTPSDALRAFEAYNAIALRCGLPQAARLTPDRQRKIIARLREYGPEGWQRALDNLETSAFLRGQTDKAFRADLDFVVQAKSFGRLHDGGYGNGAKSTRASPPPPPKRPEWEIEAELQEFARSQAQ